MAGRAPVDGEVVEGEEDELADFEAEEEEGEEEEEDAVVVAERLYGDWAYWGAGLDAGGDEVGERGVEVATERRLKGICTAWWCAWSAAAWKTRPLLLRRSGRSAEAIMRVMAKGGMVEGGVVVVIGVGEDARRRIVNVNINGNECIFT